MVNVDGTHANPRSGSTARARRWALGAALLVVSTGLSSPDAQGQVGAAAVKPSGVSVSTLRGAIGARSATKERLEGELSSARTTLGRTQNSYVARTRALYRLTRPGRTPVAAGLDAVRTHVARVARLRRLVTRSGRDVARLQGVVEGLSAQLDQVHEQLQISRVELSRLESAPMPSPTAGLTTESRASDSSAPTAFYGLRLSQQEPSGGQFAARRGTLASPVDGEVRVISARRDESDGPGLEFQAPAGTPVRAVAGGRVAFSDVYGSYGRLVILDHGDTFYTVYGGLGSVEVRVGDDLSRRARIGSIASGEPAALFFEVRKGTRTLDPRAWVGL